MDGWVGGWVDGHCPCWSLGGEVLHWNSPFHASAHGCPHICPMQSIIPFIILLVLTPHLIVAYVVAISSGLSVAASLLLPW